MFFQSTLFYINVYKCVLLKYVMWHIKLTRKKIAKSKPEEIQIQMSHCRAKSENLNCGGIFLKIRRNSKIFYHNLSIAHFISYNLFYIQNAPRCYVVEQIAKTWNIANKTDIESCGGILSKQRQSSKISEYICFTFLQFLWKAKVLQLKSTSRFVVPFSR